MIGEFVMVIRRIGSSLALASLMLVSLTACSGPTKEQRRQLDALVGKTEVDVVRAFGVPTRTFLANNHLFLAYIDNETQYYPGSMGWGWGWGGPGWGGPGWGGWGGMGGWGGWGMGGWGMGGGFPPSYYNSVCQTTFELSEGLVRGWTMRGDGC
ncbi:hypothetical protein A0U92_08810 [Acetobacter aceti]|uniref:Lipoprotein n=2 Tax=Acetobacter aceti TaxID=435 RepID=A0A1U9KGD2_ACEAC|nr:hypothetical protein [Acetobacter aceti]AQS84862.1 hypothetical protein A0U92_08810 [Acetobacter aceti]